MADRLPCVCCLQGGENPPNQALAPKGSVLAVCDRCFDLCPDDYHAPLDGPANGGSA